MSNGNQFDVLALKLSIKISTWTLQKS